MKPEDHRKAFEEHKEAIFEWALKIKGIEKSRRIIGLHAGRGIVELLSAFLESKGFVKPGSQLNHRWFKSFRIAERLPNFPQKEKIIKDLITLEILSENLAYGSPKSREEIKKAVNLFKKIEERIKKLENDR